MSIKSNIWKMYLYRVFATAWAVAPILIPFFMSHGLAATDIFIIESAYLIGFLILEIPSGYISDVIGRKKTLIIGSAFIPLGIFTYINSSTITGFIFAELILAFANSMKSGTDSAIMYDTLIELKKTKEYKKTEGIAHFFAGSGEAVASLAGGFLAISSLLYPFYFNFITGLFTLFIVFSLKEPKRKKKIANNHLKEIIKIVKYALTHVKIRSIIIYSAFLTSSGIMGYWMFYMYYESIGLSYSIYGIMSAILIMASAIGAKFSHIIEEKIGMRNSLNLLLCLGFVYLAFGLIKSRWMLPFVIVSGLAWGISTPIIYDAINKIIKSDIRATVLSVSSMATSLMFIIIAPIFGKIIDLISISAGLISLGLFFLVGLSFSMHQIKKHRVA